MTEHHNRCILRPARSAGFQVSSILHLHPMSHFPLALVDRHRTVRDHRLLLRDHYPQWLRSTSHAIWTMVQGRLSHPHMHNHAPTYRRPLRLHHPLVRSPLFAYPVKYCVLPIVASWWVNLKLLGIEPSLAGK